MSEPLDTLAGKLAELRRSRDAVAARIAQAEADAARDRALKASLDAQAAALEGAIRTLGGEP